MATDVKKTKAEPAAPKAPKKEAAAAEKSTPAADTAKAADSTKTADTAPKAEATETASTAPKNYSRGEGQKPVTQEYKDNWNAIFGKKENKKKKR